MRYLGRYIVAVVAVVGLMLRVDSTVRSFTPFISTLSPIWQHPGASYAEKMTMLYPEYYPLIERIRHETSVDSKIYVPSVDIPYGQPLWPLGNVQLTRALIYPRQVALYTGVETDGYIVQVTSEGKLMLWK